MKHLYDNGEGELVVADSLEDAHRYHDIELGGEDDPAEIAHLLEGWVQVEDDAEVPIIQDDEKTTETKTAKEWASEHDTVTQVATTYW